MDAMISGNAGRAILLEGEELLSFDLESGQDWVQRQPHEFPYLLGEISDFQILENTNREKAVQNLRSAYDANTALQLTLMALDPETDGQLGQEASQELDQLLADPVVEERLESVLYARPLPQSSSLGQGLNFAAQQPRTLGLLQRLQLRQGLIKRVFEAWQRVPDRFFSRNYDRKSFYRQLLLAGLLKDLVLQLESGRSIDELLSKAARPPSIVDLPGVRKVLERFSSELLILGAEGKLDSSERRHRTVLMVDDTEVISHLVGEMLSLSGYEVLLASDGEEALQVAGHHKGSIDLLLTDVTMPRMGGVELARRLREEDPSLPVIFVSSHKDEVQSGRLQDLGALIQNPFTELVSRVREALKA